MVGLIVALGLAAYLIYVLMTAEKL
ncbi:K(+)-transporting ATPase subunit F [Microbispora siamensis]